MYKASIEISTSSDIISLSFNDNHICKPKLEFTKIIFMTQKVCSQEGVAAAHLNTGIFTTYYAFLHVLYTKITACAIGCEFDTITKVHYYVEKMETSCYCVFRLLNDEYNAKDQLCAVFGIHCIIICILYK